MEKVGIFGGTFDPPHKGHMQAAKFAKQKLGLDRIIWLPCSSTPGKSKTVHGASPEQRLAMTELAVRNEPGMEICDWDVRRGGETYTEDTVRQLRKSFPDAKLYLLLGSDIFLTTDKWRNTLEISKEVTYVVFARGDANEKVAIASQCAVMQGNGAEIVVLDNPICGISSTQVRRLIAFHAAKDFLDDAVSDFISNNCLYDCNADWNNLSMEELESIVIRLLNPNRVKHVLGVRDTAVELAQKWGVNPHDAGRAGILHDITKALDGPLQLTLCDCYGKLLSDFSRRYPKTLHAATGALVAEKIFGENRAVVDAIHCHTTGKANMNTLEKIIYVADYMEPNRSFPGVEKLRYLAYTDLTQALRLGLEMTLEHLHNQGNEVSPESKEALEYLDQMILH